MFEHLPQSVNDFHDSILYNMFYGLKLNFLKDNYDHASQNLDGKDHSLEFNPAQHVVALNNYFHNATSLFEAYNHLADDESKRIFLHLICFRLAGHLSVRIPSQFAKNQDKLADLNQYQIPSPSALHTSGMFGLLNHYDFEYEDKHYVIDCVGLEYNLAYKQYFYERDGIKIEPEEGDYLIDGGACWGDTALVFSNVVKENGRVYAFDPVEENLEVIKYNIEQFPYKNVEVYECGLSDKIVDAPPIRLGGYAPAFSSSFSEANQQLVVPVATIDAFVQSGLIPKVDFIKLDVEGSEMATLLGADYTINTFKPKLAVSLYHKPNDLFEITNYLADKYPFYEFHLDHYTLHQGETVLYCKPLH